MATPADDPKFEELLQYLKRNRGFDFTGYKRSSLNRRISRRMQTLHITSYEDYIDYLEMHAEEFIYLFNTILINVTNFFRDGSAWDYLRDHIVPTLIANHDGNGPIRVWSAGCASGQEAYTAAMLLAEALGRDKFSERVKIYATDLDEEALQVARQASYSSKEVSEVPPQLLDRYFEEHDGRFVFNKELRRSIIFGRNDLIQDAPISRIDLLICRNTLMYFNAETQARILNRFHFALRDRGYLMLGKAEMLYTQAALFIPFELKARVFRKVQRINTRDRLSAMSYALLDNQEQLHLTRFIRFREAAFDANPVAQVLVDTNAFIMLINERARSLLNLTKEDVSRSLFDLEIAYRITDLRLSLEAAHVERRSSLFKDIKWLTAAGETRYMEVQLDPLVDPTGKVLGASMSFTDVTNFKLLQEQVERASQELETAYEEVQSANEELETTNEELQSTVEELETTNEELQSTNEELETINEELQSTNEELQTMNAEANHRSAELNRINDFLEAILGGMRGGVVVLDTGYRVQIWNHKMEDLWGLYSAEVVEKNILSLEIGLPVRRLLPLISACISGQTNAEETVVEAINRRGKTIQCKVTCTPLIARDPHVVKGVIMLMEELDP